MRELRNAIERAVVMGNGLEIVPEDLPILHSSHSNLPMPEELSLEEAVHKFKKDFIAFNLKRAGGKRSEAAKMMNIQRTYLSRLITKYDLKNL